MSGCGFFSYFVWRLTWDLRQESRAFKNRTHWEIASKFLRLGSAGVIFCNSLTRSGVCFQISETWLTSVIIPAMSCVSQPLFWKGRLGKTCLSKMQRNQVQTLSLNSTKVSCQIERSWRALQLTFLSVGCFGFFFFCAVGFFLNKNATRCNPKPCNKFWPELGI